MNLIKENIDNLTHLWQIVGLRANAFTSLKDFNYCQVHYSDWPNRLWFKIGINRTNLASATNFLQKTSVLLKIPYWDIYDNGAGLFSEYGFEKTSQQIGMSVKLSRQYDTNKLVRLESVSNMEQATLWSELFQKAFNYKICDTLVMLSCHDVKYLIAYHQHEAVGTCMLYHNSKEVIGIHSLGIIPEMRRKGYADELFRQVLDRSAKQNFTYATLQASEMAKPMYDKLGFTSDFIMANYELKK